MLTKNLYKKVSREIEKGSSIFKRSWSDCICNGRFLGESGRLIAGIIETCDLEQLEGYLTAIDFKKIFYSLNHNLLITALEHYGFDNDFIEWIKILPKNQESCVTNGCHTKK